MTVREIQDVAIQEQLNSFRNAIIGGKITINGTEQELPIYQSRIRGDTLRIYLKVPSEMQGVITRAAIFDGLRREWQVKTMQYTKGSDGYIIVFPYRFAVQPFVSEEERAEYE